MTCHNPTLSHTPSPPSPLTVSWRLPRQFRPAPPSVHACQQHRRHCRASQSSLLAINCPSHLIMPPPPPPPESCPQPIKHTCSAHLRCHRTYLLTAASSNALTARRQPMAMRSQGGSEGARWRQCARMGGVECMARRSRRARCREGRRWVRVRMGGERAMTNTDLAPGIVKAQAAGRKGLRQRAVRVRLQQQAHSLLRPLPNAHPRTHSGDARTRRASGERRLFGKTQ